MTDDPHVTLITKRNWDALLLPILCVTLVCAVLLGAFAGFWRGLALPGFTLAIWLLLRLTTPTDGTKAVAINGNPKVKALLKWLSFFVIMTAGWAFVETVLLGRSLHDPLAMSQIVVFVFMIALLLAGVFVIERRFPADTKSPHDGG